LRAAPADASAERDCACAASSPPSSPTRHPFALPSSPLIRLYWLIFGSARGRSNAEGMLVTLEKMKAVVESG